MDLTIKNVINNFINCNVITHQNIFNPIDPLALASQIMNIEIKNSSQSEKKSEAVVDYNTLS